MTAVAIETGNASPEASMKWHPKSRENEPATYIENEVKALQEAYAAKPHMDAALEAEKGIRELDEAEKRDMGSGVLSALRGTSSRERWAAGFASDKAGDNYDIHQRRLAQPRSANDSYNDALIAAARRRRREQVFGRHR